MIVVTAPTGRIGSKLLPRLLAAGAPLRLISRHPDTLAPEVREQVEVVTGSHGDRDVVMDALDGADALFWLVLADPQAPSVEAAFTDFTRAAVEAIQKHQVGHVVSISALGRGTPYAGKAGLVTGSLAQDELIAGTGTNHRALTLHGFMDNVLWQLPLIKDQGVFVEAQPADLALPRIATADIASVAASLLLERSWTGSAEVPLLGPEDLSHNDMATIMSEVLERPISYREIPIEAYKSSFLERGFSDAMAQAMVDMAVAKANGLDQGVVRTPQNSSPTSFRQWCEEVLKPAIKR